MPRKRELTYHKQGRCWRKYRNGKRYYLDPRGVRKSDAQAYEQALANWQALLTELEADELLGISRPYSQSDVKRIARQTLPVDCHKCDVAPEIVAVSLTMASDYSALLPSLASNGLAVGDTSLEALKAYYLGERRAEVNAGLISAKMYAEHSAKLDDFQSFASHFQRTDINNVDTDLLTAYRREQMNRISKAKADGGISKATARKRLQIVQRFMTWAYKVEALKELPRILLSDFAKIKLNPPKPTFYTPDEVRTLFDAASPRLQAAMMLACNCGFTQADVATLTWDMIDAKTRILKRERSKTGVESQHRLWPSTLKALRSISKAKAGVIFNGPRGPLLQQTVGDDGKVKLYDQIFIDYRGLKRKLNLDDDARTFKHIRKSAANEIAKGFQDKPYLTDQFLSHSVGAMKKHYVAQHFDELFTACDYLESVYQLGVETLAGSTS